MLLSVPGADSTTSLYYTDPEYDELADLVGVSAADRHVREDSVRCRGLGCELAHCSSGAPG